MFEEVSFRKSEKKIIIKKRRERKKLYVSTYSKSKYTIIKSVLILKINTANIKFSVIPFSRCRGEKRNTIAAPHIEAHKLNQCNILQQMYFVSKLVQFLQTNAKNSLLQNSAS